MSKMNSTPDIIYNRLDIPEEKISKLEDIAIEPIQHEKLGGNQTEINEQSIK